MPRPLESGNQSPGGHEDAQFPFQKLAEQMAASVTETRALRGTCQQLADRLESSELTISQSREVTAQLVVVSKALVAATEKTTAANGGVIEAVDKNTAAVNRMCDTQDRHDAILTRIADLLQKVLDDRSAGRA